MARATPSLGVGCHVVLVDGEPVSRRASIPTLVDQNTGCFPPSLSTFLARLFTGRIRIRRNRSRSRRADRTCSRSRGLRLTHIDTHKHTHMFPAVLRPVLRAARAAGIRAVRNPFEPEWAVRATPGAPRLVPPRSIVFCDCEPPFRRIDRRRRLRHHRRHHRRAGHRNPRRRHGPLPARPPPRMAHGNWSRTPATTTPISPRSAPACAPLATSSGRPSRASGNSPPSNSSPIPDLDPNLADRPTPP